MKVLFQHELKKIFCSRFLLFSVLFFLLINSMYIIRNQKTYADRFNQSAIDAGWEMYKNVEGPITEEKLQSLNTYIEKLQKDEIPENGYYHSKYFDLTESQNLLREIQSAKSYVSSNENRLALNEKIRQGLTTSSDPYIVKQCEMIRRDYTNRAITSFYRTNSYEQYFGYDFSSLLLILILFLASSSLFAKEKETGMSKLQLSTVSGRSTLTLCKLGAFTVFLLAVFVLFSVSDYFLFLWRERLTGGSNPIYSMPSYSDSPLSISIGMFVFVNAGYKILGLLVLSAFSCLSSKIGRQSWVVLVFDLLILFFCMVLSTCSGGIFPYLNTWNPICLLVIRNTVCSYETLRILSVPIYKHFAILACGTIGYCILLFAVFLLDRTRGVHHVT